MTPELVTAELFAIIGLLGCLLILMAVHADWADR